MHTFRWPWIRRTAARQSGRLVLLLGALLAAACGDEAPRPALQGKTAPAGADARPESAFRLLLDPDGVRHDIPVEQVKRGLQVPNPRDRIPALLAPRFVPAEGAEHVGPRERVLVLAAGDEAHAYPLRMLDAHELVNDVLGGEPLLVSWCPLCRSAMVFERRVAGEVRTFGVSGYLYRSAVLMYDHQSETFWSQIAARAVAGPLTGTRLVERPLQTTSFEAFRRTHPAGQVLGPEQAGRSPSDYQAGHYDEYHTRSGLMFQVDAYDRRLELKDEVLGVTLGAASHAWSLDWLRAQGPVAGPFGVGGERVTVAYDQEADAFWVVDGAGRPVPHLRCYWFAWFAFHQDTGLTTGG